MKKVQIKNGNKTIALFDSESTERYDLYNDIHKHILAVFPNIHIHKIDHDGTIAGFLQSGEAFDWTWRAKDIT